MIHAKRCVRAVCALVILAGAVRAGAAPAASSGEAGVLARRKSATGATVTALIGDVRIHTDGQGRLAIAVDEQKEGEFPDGSADRLFLFQGANPITERIDERLRLASVTFTDGALRVFSPGSRLIVDLSVAASARERHEIAPGRIVLHDGIALQSRALRDPRASVESLRTEDFVVVAPQGLQAASASSCDAGGEGAQTCTYKCAMSTASVSKSDECAVACGFGYYACCGCNWLYDARCQCVKETVRSGDSEMRIDRW